MNKNGFVVRSSQRCVSSSWSDWSVCCAVNDRCGVFLLPCVRLVEGAVLKTVGGKPFTGSIPVHGVSVG